MVCFLIGFTIATYAGYRMVYLLTFKPWEECSSCGWITKHDNDTCAGCGRERE